MSEASRKASAEALEEAHRRLEGVKLATAITQGSAEALNSEQTEGLWGEFGIDSVVAMNSAFLFAESAALTLARMMSDGELTPEDILREGSPSIWSDGMLHGLMLARVLAERDV